MGQQKKLLIQQVYRLHWKQEYTRGIKKFQMFFSALLSR